MLLFIHMDDLGIIKEKLGNASLSSKELAMWSAALDAMNEKELEAVLEMIDLGASAIHIATDNLSAKMEALDRENAAGWNSILEHEGKIIESA